MSEPLDSGVWYDHHPGVDIVRGKEFHVHHVIEKSAYLALEDELQQAKAEIERLLNARRADNDCRREEITRLRTALERIAVGVADPASLVGANGPATFGERLLWRIDRMRDLAARHWRINFN